MADALIEALKSGNLPAVRSAVKSDPKGAAHPRAIGEAARRAFLPGIQLLHQHGADLNASYRNYRPLHALLQEDAHAAAGQPSPERLACLDWMLEHGADPEQLGAWPAARALIIAAFVGLPVYVERLRKAGAVLDGFTGAALGDRKLVERALGDRPNFARERDSGGLTALQCASGSRMPGAPVAEIARLLLDAGAKPAALTKSWSHDVDAMYFAVGANHGPIVEMLLDHGADPTAALGNAVWSAKPDLAELALERGGEPDRATANGKPLLNDLIRWGQIPGVLWMLAHGASPNIADADGWTAVHQAASRGNARILKAVLNAGGDFRRRDHEGRTPIGIARKAGREALVDLMMERE